MQYERVVDGIFRFMDREIFPNMNDLQEVMARIAVSRVLGNGGLKQQLIENPFVRTFAIIDHDGNVDVDGLMRDLKEQIRAKEKLEISVPMFGRFTFHESDVENLHRTIMEGQHENYS